MIKNEYLAALDNGKEIVVISSNPLFDSAIFWKENNHYFSFSRNLGEMKRTDLTPERLKNHFNNMLEEGSKLFIRGND